MTDLVLSPDQQAAYNAISAFLVSPDERIFVLEGYAGTGKSTLVKYVLDHIDHLLETARLIFPDLPQREIVLTATTNKAAEALAQITNQNVRTIHSVMGLRVKTDFKTGKTTLASTNKGVVVSDALLIVDEASYVDSFLLREIINGVCKNTKILFIGDPAQLVPVQSSTTPVFNAGFKTARLTNVVRQAEGNPIIELCTKFRGVVNGEDFFSFVPDGQAVVYLDREQFDQAIIKEFTRPDWSYQDSKVLAWRNKTVIAYNHAIRNLVDGLPQLQKGDYAVCNHYIKTGTCRLKTDQMVQIVSIAPDMEHGVEGFIVEMSGYNVAFLPASYEEKKRAIKEARANGEYTKAFYMENNWIDLRAAYACTINKSQGSTFDRVFIDLDDIRHCHNGNQIARMLYVAISRARYQVFLTGDLVA